MLLIMMTRLSSKASLSIYKDFKCEELHVIIGGDFNLVFDLDKDKQRRCSAKVVQEFI